MAERIWTCKIGGDVVVPNGGDYPMRRLVAQAFREVTGEDPEFIFSGWAGELTEPERAVVEDRLPDPLLVARECEDRAFRNLDDAENAHIRREGGARDDPGPCGTGSSTVGVDDVQP